MPHQIKAYLVLIIFLCLSNQLFGQQPHHPQIKELIPIILVSIIGLILIVWGYKKIKRLLSGNHQPSERPIVLNLNELKNILAQGKNQQVINGLLMLDESFKDQSFHEHVILVSAQWKEHQKKVITGTSSPDELDTERHKINMRLLKIIQNQIDAVGQKT